MAAFWDGVKLAGVLFVGVIVLLCGIVLYAILDTFEALSRIVKGKR